MLDVANQLTATALIDVTRAAYLVARIQANVLIRLAEEPVATFGIRAGLIADRAGARLAVARLLGQPLTPRQAFTAAKDIAVWTAGTERIVREAPCI